MSLPSKLPVQQSAPCGDSNTLNRDKLTSSIPLAANDIKNLGEEGDETVKRRHDGYLPPMREDDNAPYEGGNISLYNDKDSNSIPFGNQQNRVRTPLYGVPATLKS